MSHLVERMAYIGATPWHGLGHQLTEEATIETWQQEAGHDWEAKLTPVRYTREFIDLDGTLRTAYAEKTDARVLYRSDTGAALGVVSARYRPVQPKEVLEFYRDLTASHGFVLDTAGTLQGGARLWALARTPATFTLAGNDVVRGFLLLATSYDGTLATQARFTSIRVVCNNTLSLASSHGRADVTIPHVSTFDADSVKQALSIGDAWETFRGHADAMAHRIVTRDETVRFLLDAYFGLTSTETIKEFQDNPANEMRGRKLMERLTKALFESPGARTASARGTLWGALQAVTFDVDHCKPARSQANRLNAAWFGAGEAVKQRAWDAALRLAA